VFVAFVKSIVELVIKIDAVELDGNCVVLLIKADELEEALAITTKGR